MRLGPLPLLLLASVCVTSCASSRVTLDDYAGVYSTHFKGRPDQGRICAVLANHGSEPVGWVRLRLVARSELGPEPTRRRSVWTYPQVIAPGERVAVELENPPIAQDIRLSVQRFPGTGRPLPGRRLRASEHCSEQTLADALEHESRERTAAVEIRRSSRPAQPVLMADPQ